MAKKTVELDLRIDTGNSAQAIDKVDKSVDNLNADLNKTNTATTNQQTGFGKLQSMSAGVVAGYAAIAAGMAKVIQMAQESIQEFLTADKVQQQVNQSFGTYSDEISNAANAFEKATTLEAEKFMELSIAAKAYGATNADVNDIVNKSIGLAKQFEINGISQEQALKALVKAQNGQYGALEKIYPALAKVTDETEKMRIVNDFAAQGWKKLNAYSDTYSGKLALMENEIGNVKETVGEGILSGLMGDGPKEIQELTDSVADFSAALQETKFIENYISNLIEPFQMLGEIFQSVLDLFGGADSDINGFAVAMDALSFTMELATTPLKVILSVVQSLIQVLSGDFKGALKTILKPLTDLLEPLIKLGKELGIVSEDFELFAEESTSSLNDTINAVERFGGETAKAYNKSKIAQDDLLEASKTFAESFIGLTKDEQLAVQELTLNWRKGSQERIKSYIEEQTIFGVIDAQKLQDLANSLKAMQEEYKKDLEIYKALNKSRLKENVETDGKMLENMTTSYERALIEMNIKEAEFNGQYDRLLEERIKLLYYEIDEEIDKWDKLLANEQINLDQYNELYIKYTQDLQIKIGELVLAEQERRNALLIGGEEDLLLRLSEKIKEKMAENIDEESSWLATALGIDNESAELLVNKGMESAFNIADKINEIVLNKQQELFDAKQLQLDDQLERELNATEGNEAEQNRIKTKFARHQIQLDKDIAEAKKRNSMKAAIIDGAKSISGIWAQYGSNPVVAGILSALAGATVAAQLSLISSQKFAKGGILKGPSHQNGGILTQFGELEGNEYVINKKATKRYTPVLDKINAYGNGESKELIDYALLSTMIGEKINDKKVYVVSSDMSKQQGIDTKIINRATI